MEDHKKVLSIQIPIEVEVEVLKLHFEADTEARMVDIINMKLSLMEVDEEILEEEEVMEVVVEIIEVNNQIATQIAITMENLGTWQRTIIKRSMMHEMEKIQQGNYASTSNQGDEQLFVIQHMANSMIGVVLDNNVWYVDFGEWFRDTKDLKTPGFVETGDDTTHPITQFGKVPLSMQDGQTKYLKDVLHVPTITKKLVSVGQMVEQGLQVTFNPNGRFVEDMMNQGKLIAKGERNGRMFTLDVNMPKVNSMLFTHGKGAGDIGIWHKRIGHVNLQRLKLMEKQNLVGGLPKFGTEEGM
jgi:hypothetical protein